MQRLISSWSREFSTAAEGAFVTSGIEYQISLSDDEQLLGLHALRARVGRRSAEEVAEMVGVIALRDRSRERIAQRVNGFGLERGTRRRAVECHHFGRSLGKRCELVLGARYRWDARARMQMSPRVFGGVKTDGSGFAPPE